LGYSSRPNLWFLCKGWELLWVAQVTAVDQGLVHLLPQPNLALQAVLN
jgi:hypothetical protein